MDNAARLGSDEPFRLFIESVRDYAIFMLDPEGHVTTWNSGAERLKGYSQSEAVGQHFSIFYTDDARRRDRPREALRQAAEKGVFQDEGWRVRKDGSRFWAHVTITAIRDPEGRLLGFGKVTRDLTEQKEAQDELREAAERFRELAENIHEVFWIVTPDMREALYVSPAYERIWGRPLATAYENPRSWVEAVHPEDRQRVDAALAGLANGEYDIEFRIAHPDGGIRWVHARGFPVRQEEGPVRRVVGIAEDVTERREREEEQRYLAEAGQILSSSLDYRETLARVARLVVPSLADWCAVYTEEGGALRLVEVAHRDPEKVALAWEFRRRYPPDPEAPTGSYNVFRTGEPEIIPEISDEVLEKLSPDPEFKRLVRELGLGSAMTVPIAARGRTLGVITLVTAESRRRFEEADLAFAEALASRAALAIDNARLHRESEAARGEAERRAREEAALRDAASAVTASFTVEDVIRQISESALSATNSDGAFVERIDSGASQVETVAAAGEITPPIGSREAFAGSFVELVVERDAPEAIPRLDAADRPFPGDLARECPECSALIVPLVNAGEPIGALILVRAPERLDFRADEVERALTFGDLAALAFRKVHILEESERRREELERVTESRARLMRGFSHDLKNPLGAADGFLQLIDEGIMDGVAPRAREGIGRARRAIRSALSLIDDLLNLARAEAGQIELRWAPTDVREAAREMAEDYRANAEAEGLELELDLPDDFPVITSDPARIRQILGNLISNAVKYTPRGGRVRVGADVREEEGVAGESACVAITVADTGPGIAPEQQRLLFREFTRLDTAGETAGAGIGLAISKRVANALGGELTLESEPGRGSSFTLWLPLARDAAPSRRGG